MVAEVEFLTGRIKFGGSPHSAPFPSAVVTFRRESGGDDGEVSLIWQGDKFVGWTVGGQLMK